MYCLLEWIPSVNRKDQVLTPSDANEGKQMEVTKRLHIQNLFEIQSSTVRENNWTISKDSLLAYLCLLILKNCGPVNNEQHHCTDDSHKRKLFHLRSKCSPYFHLEVKPF